MTEGLTARLHRLSSQWGPPGREQKIAALLHELMAPLVTEVNIDRFGNLIARRPGGPGAKRLLLTAHMDTIGAVAMNVSEQGLIRLAPVGSFKTQHAIGQRVVWGSGAVGILQHEAVEKAGDLDFKKLWCDIGASDRAEALENVQLGDMCVLVGDLQPMGDLIAGPGLDNRAGCAVLVEVAEHLTDTDHEVIFAFTAQGVIGPRGAGPVAYATQPDLALVVDLAASGDLPGAAPVDLKLGHGPALRMKDTAYMAHHGVSGMVRRMAEAERIPLQIEIVTADGGLSDAQVIARTGQGVPTAVIDLPARYRGTGMEMVNLRDLHGAADLLLKLIEGSLEY